MKVPHDPKEMVALVDEEDKIIGRATRKDAHEKGLLHREVYVVVFNSRREVLLQKRKDLHIWVDCSAAGHFPFHQTYLEGAIRETREELGLLLDESELKLVAKWRLSSTSHSGNNERHAYVYFVKKDIELYELNPDETEVEELKFFKLNELEKLKKQELPDKKLHFRILKKIKEFLRQ